MSHVLALIPARVNSQGVPLKNWKSLAGGLSCVDRALLCARHAGVPASQIILSTDSDYPEEPPHVEIAFRLLKRPAELAQDTTPMLDVVRHAIAAYPGEPDDIWLLLQPTQPLREPKHIQQAIALLRESWAESVVSVVSAESPDKLLRIEAGVLVEWDEGIGVHWATERRQDARSAWKRDGTCYTFFRRTVATHGNIYGSRCLPLIIPPEETCPLDTMQDWADAERRLRARE